jgi:cytochrome o ubiquinol oxidase operon protein cyoD
MDRAGMGKAGLKSYVTGFLFSVILTAMAFAVVMFGTGLPHGVILTFILGDAVLQILVHLHYFLHLDASSSARWNVLALVSTVIIIILFVGGSIWIMSNLHTRMM